jgi:ABC-type antimicrobial peptide transport system permease subunit
LSSTPTERRTAAIVSRSIVPFTFTMLALGIAAIMALVLGMLYGTAPLDVATFVVTSIGVLVIAALASYVPARRAASVSPTESLRAE